MVIENMSNENLCGDLAYSLAGHDKGNLYVILSVEGDIAYLADGRLKLIDRPKKKKLRHLQVVKKDFRQVLTESNETAGSITNENVKRAIKLFLREGKEAD